MDAESGGAPADTLVVPVLETRVVPNRNIVFAASFGLAWRALADRTGGRVSIRGGSALADALSAEDARLSKIEGKSCVADAGEGPAFLAALGDRLARTFGPNEPFGLPASLRETQVLAYAYLSKSLVFREPFLVDEEEGLFFFGGNAGGTARAQVVGFGLWPEEGTSNWEARAAQISVGHYASPSDWVVEIATKSEQDRLLIGRIPGVVTLREAAAHLRANAPEGRSFFSRLLGKQRFGRADVLRVPVLDLDAERVFEELAGKIVETIGPIEAAVQKVKFRLDEKGALLKSSGMILVARGGPSGRAFVCNGPFFVMLLSRGAEVPYFIGSFTSAAGMRKIRK